MNPENTAGDEMKRLKPKQSYKKKKKRDIYAPQESCMP